MAYTFGVAHTKTLLVVGLLAGLGFTFLATRSQAQGLKTGASAPAFSGVASNGKTISLASVTKSGKPTVLYFIGHTCPVNAQAVKFYQRLEASTRGKVNFVGVIDTDEAGYKTWQAKNKATYPVIFDPNLKIIKAFKAQASPWSVILDAKGNVADEFPGYSEYDLKAHSTLLAKLAKTTFAPLDTAGAPKDSRYG